MTRFVPDVPAAVAVLDPFVAAGVFGPGEVQLAATVARVSPEADDAVLLAVAVAARAPQLGHVGIELARVADRILEVDAGSDLALPWPAADAWVQAVTASPLVATPATYQDVPRRPLVWDGERIYLQRYFAYEQTVAGDLRDRADRQSLTVGAAVDPGLAAVLDPLFPPPADGSIDLQRRAAEVALTARVSVVAGGPGTGKTRTIARLLVAAHTRPVAAGEPLSVALAAPTGKASARMTDAVHQAVAETERDGVVLPVVAERVRAAEATTIHRLLKSWGGVRFGHDRFQPLPHDLVIVDETSMVALPLMARLLDALRPEARLVLVGDPDQLASVEAGTVLADLVGPSRSGGAAAGGVGPLTGRVTTLERVHRFGADSGIARLADAVRRGDVDTAVGLLDGSTPDLRWVRPDEGAAVAAVEERLVAAGLTVVDAARAGDGAAALAAAAEHKVLAAVRQGPNGRFDWVRRVERAVIERAGDVDRRGPWYVGRPVLLTRNDPLNGVFNGDTGVAVAAPGGGLAVALPDGRQDAGFRLIPPARLHEVEPWWAMTIHKSQGSEFPHVVVALPAAAASPVLTRELLYTAITRARHEVTLVATDEALRAAIARPVARASGLAALLWS